MQIVPSNILEAEVTDEAFTDGDGYYQLEAGLWCELIDSKLYTVVIH